MKEASNKKIDTCVWIEFGKIATTLAHRAWGRCCLFVAGQRNIELVRVFSGKTPPQWKIVVLSVECGRSGRRESGH